MKYPIRKIADIVGGTFIFNSTSEDIGILLTDSRQLSIPKQTLFFCLRGERKHGHDYISELISHGVNNFVVERSWKIPPKLEANFIVVENTLQALQKLCKYHRQNYNFPILGITGSNGKTVIKEWLGQLLSKEYQVVKSPKSYNSQIGVPLSLWEISDNHEIGIFEAGISMPDEMRILEDLIQPNFGIISNIGAAHDVGFSSRREKLYEKLQLFTNSDVVIYNRDSEKIHEAILDLGFPNLSWGVSSESDIRYEFEVGTFSTTIHCAFRGQSFQLEIPFVDDASIENAMHCFAFLCALGCPELSKEMIHLEVVEMRLEVVEGINNTTIVYDAYNADLTSLTNTLSLAERRADGRVKSILLTDFLQSGMSSERLYQRISDLILQFGFKKVYGLGNAVSLLSQFLDHSVEQHYFSSISELQIRFQEHSIEDELLVIKGARKFKLERILHQLESQNHRTFLEINLGALGRNFKAFENYIPTKTKILVMVKANAYGGGVGEIAKFLKSRRVDYFGVAYVDEGVQLRKMGIETPVLVLNSEKSNFEKIIANNLEPEIYSFKMLKEFHTFCQQREVKHYPVHVKLDTGMHRLGFMHADLDEIIEFLVSIDTLHVESIFTHLVASDDVNERDFTLTQIDEFNAMYGQVANALGYQPLRHILNSHGIINYPEYSFEMVRLGIGLYGYMENVGGKIILEHVHRLVTRIGQIKTVESGASIGYSRKGRVEKKSRIAILNIGYADGIMRSTSNGKFSVKINEKLFPIIGNVCMDMTMINLQEDYSIQEGQEVEVFGPDYSIKHLANAAGTIPYEILTNISGRVKKIYVFDT